MADHHAVHTGTYQLPERLQLHLMQMAPRMGDGWGRRMGIGLSVPMTREMLGGCQQPVLLHAAHVRDAAA